MLDPEDADSFPGVEFVATTFVEGVDALQVEILHAAVDNAEAVKDQGAPVRSFSLISELRNRSFTHIR